MAFFARPNLDDTQFKQLPDSVLSLSGVTNIENVTGFTLIDDTNTKIPIVVTGATNDYVMTYDSGDGTVKLKPSASAGAFNYSGASPTTCTVGGLTSGSPIYNCPIGEILQSILVPTLNPTLVAPSNTLSISPTTTLYEVNTGVTTVICGVATLNLGCICPLYAGVPPFACVTRSTGAIKYRFSNSYNPVPVDIPVAGGVLSCSYPMTIPISYGTNTICSSVAYCSGVQPYKSDCVTPYCTPLASGFTATCTRTVTGVYPYFWGSTTIAPIITGDTCAQCLINSGTKVVGYSTDDVSVNYNACGKYLWVAIPATSTTKTKWQGTNSPLNTEPIPGATFSGACARNITSPSSCWGSTSYKIYVSNYATSTIEAGVPYCIIFKNS